VRSTNSMLLDDVIWSSRTVDFGEIICDGGFYKLHFRSAIKATPPFGRIQIVCIFMRRRWFVSHRRTPYFKEREIASSLPDEV
jgi:hypothetical protein